MLRKLSVLHNAGNKLKFPLMKQIYFRLPAILLILGISSAPFDTTTEKKLLAGELISGEYCEWQSFNQSCPPGHVLDIRVARYGRMKESRECITMDFLQKECSVNVTTLVEHTCTGRRSCQFRVIELHDLGTCHKDFKSYLEVKHTCIKVVTSKNGCPLGSSALSSSSHHHNNNNNPSSDVWKYISTTSNFKESPPSLVNVESFSNHYIENTASGILSSSVAMETGVGTDRCPWIFNLHPLHQRLDLTFRQFTKHKSASMVTVKEIKMASIQRNGDDAMVTHIHVTSTQPSKYVSGTDAVKVSVAFSMATTTTTHSDNNHRRRNHGHGREIDELQGQQGIQEEEEAVLIEFQVTGCKPLSAPSNTWSSSDGHVTNITCNDTGEYFRLTCAGNKWFGRIGNCSEQASKRKFLGEYMHEGTAHWGLLLVVLLGVLIGFAVGFLMLMVVLAYMKKRKQRRIKCGSSDVLSSNRCNEASTDLSPFDLFDPLHHHHNHHHNHHHRNHNHHHRNHNHHQEFRFLDEEDEDEEDVGGIYGGSLLASEGYVASGNTLATPGDEFNRRNWIWSTWVRKADSGVNCGKYEGWHSKTGTGKAASTMTMMVRKMTGKTKKDRSSVDVFSRWSSGHPEAKSLDISTTTTATKSVSTAEVMDPSNHVTSPNNRLEGDKNGEELNKAFHDFAVENKICQVDHLQFRTPSSSANGCSARDPYYFKLDVNDPVNNVRDYLPFKVSDCSFFMRNSEASQIICDAAANCNSADISRQLVSQQNLQQIALQSASGVQQASANNVAQALQQPENISRRNRDSLYGVCFTTDTAPYNLLADTTLHPQQIFQQHPFRPVQEVQQQVQQEVRQQVQQHVQRSQHSFTQQQRSPCRNSSCPRHDGHRLRYNNSNNNINNNNNNDGDDDDDGNGGNDNDYDVERDITATNSKDVQSRDQLSPCTRHHHHHHHCRHHQLLNQRHHHHNPLHHHPAHNNEHHQRNVCTDDHQSAHHSQQFGRQDQHHYHHRLYHRHHHNFLKPDLVTQTPPPIPVKPKRCPLCSVSSLNTTASSSIL